MGSNISDPSNVGNKCNNALGYQIAGALIKCMSVLIGTRSERESPKMVDNT